MAHLETNIGTETIDSVVRDLQRANLFSDEVVKDLLSAGAKIMLDSIKSSFIESGHHRPGQNRRTGETLRHISSDRSPKKDKNGIPYMQIKIVGKDSRGQRFGVKGFVLNYGRRKGGKIAADYYWTTAVKNTRQLVNDKMAEIAAEKLKGE